MNHSEEIWIELLKKGDETAFRELVEHYQDKVYNTCIGLVKNEEDADDLAQEVFIEIYRSINKFRKDAKLSTWIYRIAVNKSLESMRTKKRKKRMAFLWSLPGPEEIDHSDVSHFEHPGILAENRELSQVLFTALDKLPEAQRTAFILHKVEGLSYEDISGVMDKSISSIESLMHRAKNSLQKLLYTYYKS